MGKYRFARKLQEAVLRRGNGQQPTVIIAGEERKVRCPVFAGSGTMGISCLVEEDNKIVNEGYRVVAVSFDNSDEKEKVWVCIQPVIIEKAIRFFLENNQMESKQ